MRLFREMIIVSSCWPLLPKVKFIVHWTSAEMQLFQATEAGYLPVRGSIATLPAMAKNPHMG